MTTSPTISSSFVTIASVVAIMAALAAVEMLVPLHLRDQRHRTHLAPNLALTALTFFTNFFLNAALVLVLVYLQRAGIGLIPALGLGPAAAMLVTVIGLDFAFYLAHVCMHEVPMFWRFHVVHHSDPVIDVTTTIRQHPGEGVIRYAFMAAGAVMLGATPGAFAVYRAWSAIAGLIEHANIRMPLGIDTALSLVISTPNFHKVHHSRAPEHVNTNYGNCTSLFDSLFQTRTPAREGATVDCGVDGLDEPVLLTTTGLLRLPWLFARVSALTARAEANAR